VDQCHHTVDVLLPRKSYHCFVHGNAELKAMK